MFARFASDGAELELLGDEGRVVRQAEPGTGLVAAVAPSDEEIVWVVTGTGRRAAWSGQPAARRASLAGAFAVAFGRGRRLPLEAP